VIPNRADIEPPPPRERAEPNREPQDAPTPTGRAHAGLQEESDADEKEREAADHGVAEGEVVYRSVRQDGDHTLAQPNADLAWSGLAAGISMGFSLIAEGLLRMHLPQAGWSPLVSKFGYAVGFLIVILGRQQLFTEQTLTAILPLLSRDRAQGVLSNVARVWAVILAANLAGTAIIAGVTARGGAFSPEAQHAFLEIGQAALSHGVYPTFIRGIYAGFLIASMIWLLPAAESARLWIVLFLSYVVGLGAFSHVIAGSAECLYVVFAGHATLLQYITGFLVPAFLGNAVGGVVLVAALAHVQHAPAES